MSLKVGELYAVLGLDTRGFDKGLADAENRFRQLGSNLTNIGKKFSVAITAPLLLVAGATSKLAMDAVESENLFEVSMGNMAKAAREWSVELRNQLGLNDYELRKNVGTFYNMFTSMKLPQEAAYELATGLTKLAYDMASFYNLSPEEAFLKLSAGITGEIEPLKRLGILVSEAVVQQYAYKTGIAEVGQQLTEQQKVLARYAAIMDQTSTAQGDLARTLDSPTNKIRVFQERTKLLGIQFGQLVMEMGAPLLDVGERVLKWFGDLDQEQRKQIVNLGLMAAAIGPVVIGLGALANGLSSVLSISRLAWAGVGTLIAGLGRLQFAFSAVAGGAATFGEALAFLGIGPVGLAIGAVAVLAGVIGGLVWHYNRAKQEAYEEAVALTTLADQYRNATDALGKAAVGTAAFTAAQEDQQAAMNAIAKQFPSLVAAWDEHGNAVALDTTKLEANTRAARENIAAKRQADIDAVQREIRRLEAEEKRIQGEIEKYAKLPGWQDGLFNPHAPDMPIPPGLLNPYAPDMPFTPKNRWEWEAELAQVRRDLAGAQEELNNLFYNTGEWYGPPVPEDFLNRIREGADDATGSLGQLLATWSDLLTGVNSGVNQLDKAARQQEWTIVDAGLVAARWAYEAAMAIGNQPAMQTALSIMRDAQSIRVPGLSKGGVIGASGLALVGEFGPELLHLPGGASVTPLRDEEAATTTQVVHSGTIRVEGVNDQGQLMAVSELVARELWADQDRYASVRSVRRIFR